MSEWGEQYNALSYIYMFNTLSWFIDYALSSGFPDIPLLSSSFFFFFYPISSLPQDLSIIIIII